MVSLCRSLVNTLILILTVSSNIIVMKASKTFQFFPSWFVLHGMDRAYDLLCRFDTTFIFLSFGMAHPLGSTETILLGQAFVDHDVFIENYLWARRVFSSREGYRQHVSKMFRGVLLLEQTEYVND